MWARIENGVVVELTNVNPEGRFSSQLTWMPVPDEVSFGWVHNFDGTFTPPVTEEEEVKDYKKFRELMYANPDFVYAKQQDTRFIELIVWVTNKDFDTASVVWQELKSAGLISPALESAFAGIATECGLSDEFAKTAGLLQ